MLEECGYHLGQDWLALTIDIVAGDQFTKEFLAISPNNKIPAMVDPNGPDGKPIALFESGAILLYLASKTGLFLPKTDRAKFEVLQWLMFQMGGVGPMFGQTHHFRIYAPEKVEYAINRYTNETRRLYGVMDKELAKKRFIAGKDYSIADMAIFPWTRSWKNQGVTLEEFPNVLRWHEEIAARPAVKRGVEILTSLRKPMNDDKAKEILYGKTQYQKR
jgi:GST-like protein